MKRYVHIATAIAAPYWTIRHFYWDMREWLFVKECMRKLQTSDEVFIHPLNGGPHKAILARANPTMQEMHSHVEGWRKDPRLQ